MTRVLFFRDFDAPSGGHFKVRDYFEHVRATPGYEAQIAFTEGSRWDNGNPWLSERERALKLAEWRDWKPDVLFLEGMDWPLLTPEERVKPPVPMINFIQHTRHADPENPRYQFLGYPAVRICVSPEVQAALEATGKVNGPVFTIPNGIEKLPEPGPEESRTIDVFVAGAKHPARARALGARLQGLAARKLGVFPPAFSGLRVKVQDGMVPRGEFLENLAKSRITVFLPLPQEGFYLPALEAMASGSLVVCPDVVGNRSFCRDGETCLRPEYRDGLLFEACRRALRLSGAERDGMVLRAREVSREYTLERERGMFREILGRVEGLWREVKV